MRCAASSSWQARPSDDSWAQQLVDLTAQPPYDVDDRANVPKLHVSDDLAVVENVVDLEYRVVRKLQKV
jgi:hypothetical protein